MNGTALLIAMMSVFEPDKPSPKSDWKHSDARLEKANLKRERKNKKRLNE